jgi:heme-degrading monooxygenase HmoA
MMVVVFRAIPVPGTEEDFNTRLATIYGIGSKMPGYHSIKKFTSEDGEDLFIIEFEDEATLEAWRDHPQHLEVQKEGRSKFWSRYTSQICKEIRRSEHGIPQ